MRFVSVASLHLIGPRKQSRSSTRRSVWTPDINRLAAIRRGAIGVSSTELLRQLDEVLVDLTQPVCVVGRSRPPELLETLRSRAATAPVLLDRLGDLPEWLGENPDPATIVSYLSVWRADASMLSSLRATATEESRLIFVEPTLGLGMASVLQRAAASMFVAKLGLSFRTDVPQLLRRSAWEPTTVKRFSVGFPSSVMTFVAGEARAY